LRLSFFVPPLALRPLPLQPFPHQLVTINH
jgi:hypothetical protein